MEDYTRHSTKVNVASVNFFGGVRFSKVRNWGREQTRTKEQERTGRTAGHIKVAGAGRNRRTAGAGRRTDRKSTLL